eukprot:3220709-Prymnesium_polylepis.1
MCRGGQHSSMSVGDGRSSADLAPLGPPPHVPLGSLESWSSGGAAAPQPPPPAEPERVPSRLAPDV